MFEYFMKKKPVKRRAPRINLLSKWREELITYRPSMHFNLLDPRPHYVPKDTRQAGSPPDISQIDEVVEPGPKSYHTDISQLDRDLETSRYEPHSPISDIDLDTLVGESIQSLDRESHDEVQAAETESCAERHVPNNDRDFDLWYENTQVTPDTKTPEIDEEYNFVSKGAEPVKKEYRTTKHFNLLPDLNHNYVSELKVQAELPVGDEESDVDSGTKILTFGKWFKLVVRGAKPVKKEYRTTKHFNLLNPRHGYVEKDTRRIELPVVYEKPDVGQKSVRVLQMPVKIYEQPSATASLNDCYTSAYGISNDDVIAKYNDIISKNSSLGVEEAFRLAIGIWKKDFDAYGLDRAA
jgi:hypothetical protein